MSWEYYMSEDKNISVSVNFTPGDGIGIAVRKWVRDDWVDVVDSLFICDSFFEAMCSALSYAGYDWDNAAGQCFDWGIEEPDFEEADV